MELSETPGFTKRFRRTAWKFQHTFKTPLQSLPPFVATILDSIKGLEEASVVIDDVVFDPRHLTPLLERHSIPSPVYHHDTTIRAIGREEVASLLQATLSDWIDFAFVPTPKPIVIYTDRDGFTTVFAHTKSNLNRAVIPLMDRKFKSMDYQRRF